MKFRITVLTVMLIVVTLLATTLLSIDTTALNLSPDTIVSTQNSDAPMLTVNLGWSPETVDPALASSSSDTTVVEQLFIGLVDRDEETGEINPELASSWSINADSTVYTFTLRSDIFWSNGNPVTAHDVRYGILRTLNPDTNANYAYVLYLIKNAEYYNAGNITDPNLVGVEAINDTTLRIELALPAAFLPSILSLWVAYPMPQSVIEAHGSPTWTLPANIVTNGAYLLTEWVEDDHIQLRKNTAYYDATNVQIEQINMLMVQESVTAWYMYLNEEFDTVAVPSYISSDDFPPQEVRRYPDPCTYYYGFVNNKPPFDDARVRQAFSLSADKAGLTNTLLGASGAIPSDHFAPPGMWGTPELGSVGLSYNPTTAAALLQEYLDEKNMTLADFNAMNITLMHNTSEGHGNIAAFIQQNWLDNLGVSVIVEDAEWQEYLQIISKGTPLSEVPHIYRLGWCSDYPDENNWIHEVFNNQAGSNRLRRGCVDDTCTQTNPQAFDNLTQQAGSESDPIVRKDLYFQAERILAEDEAAYLPLYHYGSLVATKPYLERTYSTFGSEDMATWRITKVNQTINTGGGSVTSYDGNTTLEIPAGTFTDSVRISHAPASRPSSSGDAAIVGGAFEITAVYSSTGQPAELTSGKTYTITISYGDALTGTVSEDDLTLRHWSGTWWAKESSSVLNKTEQTITATPNHFSIWGIMDIIDNYVYLPVVVR